MSDPSRTDNLADPHVLRSPLDAGLALEQLGESYRRLVENGVDPYDATGDARTLTHAFPDVPTDQAASSVAGRPLAALESAEDVINEVILKADDEQSKAQDANCPTSPTTILEAILFVGHPQGEPLSARTIASLMRGVTAGEIGQMVADLNDLYVQRHCPYHIQAVGGGFQLTLKPDFVPLREHFLGRVRSAKLSQPAVEALAYIAYHQPVPRATLKNVAEGEHCRVLPQLIRRGLIMLAGTEKKTGEYRTTERFLEMFGLRSLADLPQIHDVDAL